MTREALMGDPRFFRRTGPHDLATVAAAAGGAAVTAELSLTHVAPLQTAGPGAVSFLDNRKYASSLSDTRAGAVIVHPDMAHLVPAQTAAIVTREPYLGWARVAALFHPLPPSIVGIHPSAIVDPSAEIDATAEIGPLVVIEAGVKIGPRVRIGAGAFIAAAVEIGEDCRISAHVSISHAVLGRRVFLFPGVRIGQEGFGFATEKTPQGPRFVTIPQLGRVFIGDDVEIGANSTVDRGSAQDTVIGAGTRIDNLVQIGHNVIIGKCCVIVAQTGISGSTVFEDFVVAGGQSAFVGHLRIGRGARIGGQSGVTTDIPAGSEYFGSPAQPKAQAFRQIAWLRSRVAAKPRSNGVGEQTDRVAATAAKTSTDSGAGTD
jgi:UDP-3-O-[3-hydroxymyristoyl] glucosamine N-acyltransferase